MTSAEPPKGPPSALSTRARLALPIVLVALIALSVHRLVCADVPERETVLTGEALGTTWSVTIADPLTDAERGAIRREVETRLGEVDALMSTYRADSELSRFNRAEARVPFPVSAPTLEVFRIAAAVSEASTPFSNTALAETTSGSAPVSVRSACSG